jgi:hypothetical protein
LTSVWGLISCNGKMNLQTVLRRFPGLETWLSRRLVVGTMDLRDGY